MPLSVRFRNKADELLEYFFFRRFRPSLSIESTEYSEKKKIRLLSFCIAVIVINILYSLQATPCVSEIDETFRPGRRPCGVFRYVPHRLSCRARDRFDSDYYDKAAACSR